jgi:hypothetical protein
MDLAAIRAQLREAVRADPSAYSPATALSFDLRGVDLRGLDLRGADLHDRDLRGWRLEGLDLTGADLTKANLTGVSLRGTRLYGAATTFAKGLDLDGAQIHPFFAAQSGSGAVDLRWLDLDAGAAGSPRCLVSCQEDPLLYLAADGSMRWGVSVTGETFSLDPAGDHGFLGMAVDAGGRIWTLDASQMQVIVHQRGRHDDLPRRRRTSTHGLDLAHYGPLLALSPDRLGGMNLVFRHGLIRARLDGNGVLFHTNHFGAGVQLSHAVAARNGKTFGLAFANRSRVVLWSTRPDHPQTAMDLPPDTRVGGMALGPDGRIWFSYSGKGGAGFGALDPAAETCEWIKVPDLTAGAEPRDLGELAAGAADKGVWYCDGGGRIGQIRWETDRWACQEFELAPGDHPLSLTPGHDGRMLFTLAGKTRIGSIRVAPPATGEAKEARQATAAAPAPARATARIPDRLRREAAFQRDQRTATQAGESKGPESASGAGAGFDPGDGKRPAASRIPAGGAGTAKPAARDPWALLRANHVLLTPARLQHIVAAHGPGRDVDKSQFARGYDTAEAILDLLARGLDDSGAIGRIRCGGLRGGFKTLCRVPEVGLYNTGSEWLHTDWFVVVSNLAMDGVTHEVVTAYPVAPNGF